MTDILVLGATGFTGRLITRHLVNHPERTSFTLGLAGRSESKLEELKRSLGLDQSVKLYQIDVTERNQIEDAVKSAKVIISAVGPYWRLGAEVVRACVLHGKHYVDLCGESHFTRHMILRWDYVATKTKAIIVSSCGLDSVPADLLVYLANKTVKAAAGPHAGLGKSLTVYRVAGGVSGGTLSTISSTFDIPSPIISEALADYSLSTGIQGVPSARTSLYYPVPYASPPEYGMVYPMAQPNIAIVQRTWGLHQLATMKLKFHLQEEEARSYGPALSYQECVVFDSTSSKPYALLASLAYYVSLAMLFFLPPVRWLFQRVVTQPGDGPSNETMEKGFLEAINYTSSAPSVDTPRVEIKTVMRGQGDPGYLLTAVMISESALALLLDQTALPPLAREGGVLTPASALGDVLIRRLEKSGHFQFESQMVGAQIEEGRKGR
ncbi:NAD(P)-binding protein [Laetiporus sulphureus 93-53]|uniref:NAD(P)-binding protein n=1 Tax=Laetiporus sulphureus 93-53 TaxID=1314785 RepID=A0A165DR43_9APHY|nr:NAD(P)-binding protein [Laetiporus sulphureus 93-53]KZT05450.1 NAD(P)-binding protein [Laetiporus sulphureus 93-53]